MWTLIMFIGVAVGILLVATLVMRGGSPHNHRRSDADIKFRNRYGG